MVYKIINLEQGSAAWHELRKNKIGASDAAAILGVSPWATIYDLWLEKTGQKEPRKTTPAMKRGTELEPAARMLAEQMLGVCLDPLVVEHPLYPWMMASLDGINEDNTVMVEIKCAGEKDHNSAKMGIVPEKYIPQLQHQMAVTSLPSMYYFSFDGACGAFILVPRDQEYIDRLIEAEKSFYDCVMQRMPPDCREMRTLEMESDEWIDVMHAYEEARLKKDMWEKETERLKKKAIELSGGSEAQGMGFKLSKIMKKGNVMWDDICKTYQISDEVCDNFRKPITEYWTIKKEKE